MSSRWSLLLLGLVVFFGMSGLFWFNSIDTNDRGRPVRPTTDTQSSRVGDAGVDERPDRSLPDSNTGSDQHCLTPTQLMEHRDLDKERERLQSIVFFPAVRDYVGTNRGQIESMAQQGDTAAMALLGAFYVAEARGLVPEHEALPYLAREIPEDMELVRRHAVDDLAIEKYQLARDWFHKAAINGRLLALVNVGQITEIIDGDALALGWLTQEEYDEQFAWNQFLIGRLEPISMHSLLIMELAPTVRDSPLYERFRERPELTDVEERILGELVSKFQADRAEAGLLPYELPSGNAPSFDELMDLVCDEYKPDKDG